MCIHSCTFLIGKAVFVEFCKALFFSGILITIFEKADGCRSLQECEAQYESYSDKNSDQKTKWVALKDLPILNIDLFTK